jgi:hypothetical protein
MILFGEFEVWTFILRNQILAGAAGSAIIVSGTLFLWWRNRKPPSHIDVSDVATSTLLGIADSFQSRVSAFFEDQRVGTLSQITIEVTNSGLDEIEDALLTFQFPDVSKLLESEVSGVRGLSSSIDGKSLSVGIPLLNGFRDHRETVIVKALCDGNPSTFAVEGRGKGWSARRVKRYNEPTRRMLIFLAAYFGGLLFLMAILGFYLQLNLTSVWGGIGFVFLGMVLALIWMGTKALLGEWVKQAGGQ